MLDSWDTVFVDMVISPACQDTLETKQAWPFQHLSNTWPEGNQEKKSYELICHKNVKSVSRICKIKLSFNWAYIIELYSKPWHANIRCSAWIIEREEERQIELGRELLQARLEVTFCLAHIPQHERMDKQKKEGKEGTTLVEHRDGSYPCPLPPHFAFF